MSKNTLKKKIQCVKWSAVVFAIGYFLLGAFLTSTGTKFDAKKTYDLLTTSLTLTAYFLAPVAAFVLFSDWRAQHVELKTERLSEEIWALNRRIIRRFYELQPTLETGRTTIYKNEKNNLKYDIDDAKVKLFTLGGHRDIGMESFIDIGLKVNNKMIKVVADFDSIVEKIDKSIKVKDKDSDNFKFYNCELSEDWIFDLINEISELDDLNRELLEIGFTKKVNS